MLDEKRTGKMIDRKIYRTSFNKWMDIYKWWCKTIIEVKHTTRWKKTATINKFVTPKQLTKNDRNVVRKNYFENASLSYMDIVKDFSKKNDKFYTMKGNI